MSVKPDRPAYSAGQTLDGIERTPINQISRVSLTHPSLSWKRNAKAERRLNAIWLLMACVLLIAKRGAAPVAADNDSSVNLSELLDRLARVDKISGERAEFKGIAVSKGDGTLHLATKGAVVEIPVETIIEIVALGGHPNAISVVVSDPARVRPVSTGASRGTVVPDEISGLSWGITGCVVCFYLFKESWDVHVSVADDWEWPSWPIYW
jgi:hypothetical protein